MPGLLEHLLKTISALALAACLCTLGACGFQLRGSLNLPAQLQEMHVSGENEYSELVLALNQYLTSAGVALSDQAPVTLYILKEERDKQRVAVSKSAYFDEYQLINKATFELRDQAGVAVMTEQTVTAQTLYQDNAEDPASKSNEEYLLRNDLQKNLALQILRRITALDAAKLPVNNMPDI
jgi:LPS-assembly lipoprotein